MQTTGGSIAPTAELASCMQLGEYEFNTRQATDPATGARGQALYSSVSFGAGGAAGGLASGWAWERLGGGEAFALGSLFAFIGLIILFLGVRAEDVGQNRSLCVVDGGSDVGERER